MSNKWYPATAFTGGTDGCLDAIAGAEIYNGDRAIVITSSEVCFYILDVDSAATESSPDVISPDTDAEDKRWILVKSVGGNLNGSIYGVSTTDTTATDLALVDGDEILVEANTSYKFIIDLVARQTAGSGGTVGDSAFWSITGGIKRDDSDNTTLIGTPSGTGAVESANCDFSEGSSLPWSVVVEVNNTLESLKISVTGETDKTIKWSARVILVEVS